MVENLWVGRHRSGSLGLLGDPSRVITAGFIIILSVG